MMPDIVYCDNKDCCCYDDYRERCDAYRLVIEHGVCTGSPRHGRNVSWNDLDERLKAENAKLREIVAALWGCCAWETDSEGWCEECDYHDTEEGGCKLEKSLRELGIVVDWESRWNHE
jgi:hypothetical protein